MKQTIRIGTRGSQLALWQAHWVKNAIENRWPQTSTVLIPIKTKGDKILDAPLAKVGGKGLFVKEIEDALLNRRIDLAVHSMKDMPADLPSGLTIGAVPPRENPQDALVALAPATLKTLPHGARIGTSSLRRSAQIKHLRPDLKIHPLRGNLNTRLKKLENSDLDAVVLAAAGLKRLDLAHRITALLDIQSMLPAVGQGALCIETRTEDQQIGPIAQALDDTRTRTAVTAERAFLHRLEGGCQVPIAAYAEINSGLLYLTGLVAELDGSRIIKATLSGSEMQAVAMGCQLADRLLAQGAGDILKNATI